MENTATALREIRNRIRAAEQQYGRPEGSVHLLAVSKTRPAAMVLEAVAAGQTEFGENYVQEAVAKIESINRPDIHWHFIGPIQSNKTAAIATHFTWVHSLDRVKIARRLNHDRCDDQIPLQCCIQVNISREASKSGVRPDEVPALADAVAGLPRLQLRGLMALPAPETQFEQQRRTFRQLYDLILELQAVHTELDTLSIGTTHDMEAAIAEGATIVRIGTALFGARGT